MGMEMGFWQNNMGVTGGKVGVLQLLRTSRRAEIRAFSGLRVGCVKKCGVLWG